MEETKNTNKGNGKKDCCSTGTNNKDAAKEGILYGLIPHIGCIAFVIFAILGATAATTFLKPFLLNNSIFYILIGISFLFATISAVFYLRKHSSLSFNGIKEKWKYLASLYGTTILVNLVFFMFIFPATTGILTAKTIAAKTDATSAISTNTNNADTAEDTTNTLTLRVSIPCSGHAPLIIDELQNVEGITNVQYSSPNIFTIEYDGRTTKQEILGLEIFKEFSAEEVST